ncbi:MAG: tRNA (N6-adenosine(37)-N6)-threonylcarbamoyltransferase complex ATPase TsaE [Desulfobulbaceae bacterium S3730MH12]|nr:MAG: tRNA (N6-adenosine(37)-N6)-threonylcarbamoyltransferase complex ATPase TsaE [Desulfobulbaceae bacterium S5133MH15]OEU54691.1 MAG: tRNA (N6-adenosine(37)-N6)-threonylcarbamoyltransferase complex ATPase TsaE [Desulfobulbaceae bacterium S3730MH12]OEU79973.1 MAG: tRNA (N6-adenosine(37)-N6)-threonylcarbamoyltransferase complex ATPase TsaE [Desulfobulbaceae bacterium C00003063]
MLENFLFNLNSIQDTERLGLIIGNIAQSGDVICLNGCLGAGKTTMTQAIARGLGVPSNCYVTSPSYTIMHEYKGVIPLYHMDFYRLNGSGDVIDLGFEEYFYLDGLTIIEWSERAEDILPKDRVTIAISLNKDQERIARIFTSNDILASRYKKMLAALLKISKA